jgi:hypothetical protein
LKIIGDNPAASLDKVAIVLGGKCFGAFIVFVAIDRRRFEYYDGLLSKKIILHKY